VTDVQFSPTGAMILVFWLPFSLAYKLCTNRCCTGEAGSGYDFGELQLMHLTLPCVTFPHSATSRCMHVHRLSHIPLLQVRHWLDRRCGSAAGRHQVSERFPLIALQLAFYP
jgi:hypothetical protein